MKANEAPKRIYISLIPSIFGGHVYTTVNKEDFPDAVEYTRTDTFLEKACAWLEEKCDLANYEVFNPDNRTYYIDHDKMIDDFRNYMKGE